MRAKVKQNWKIVGPTIGGFVAWSIICISINTLVFLSFPSFFNEDGTSPFITINISMLALTLVYSLIAGGVNALIADTHHRRHAAVLSLLQLTVGTAVQASYWDLLPVWYHLSFLALLPLGIMAGAEFVRHRKVGPG